ncbi:MAG: magnesium transporter CorA family protein [Patescibacteria group bacterium UBA2103]
MIKRQELDGISWVDLESPNVEELEQISKEFSIDPFIVEELQAPTLKPSVISGDDYLYLILHFPVERHSHTKSSSQEVDFILGKNYIITVRYDEVDPIHKFHKTLETETIIDNEPAMHHAGELLYKIVMKLYAGVFHELDYQRDVIRRIEDEMFKGKEKEMVFEISKVSTVLRNFNILLETHATVLESFDRQAENIFGKHFTMYSKALLGEHQRTQTATNSYLQMAAGLRETNNSLLTTKQNEVMKVLTIMAFVTFPLSLIASIFGMNTSYIPIVGAPGDFWIVMGIMFGFTILFFTYFIYKKWL